MEKNIGKTDKLIRVVAGLVIIALGFYFKSWWGLIGLVPLLTASISWCPLYIMLGCSTCKTKK
jgi:hypothetical protein